MILYWYKNDLRLHDNPALVEALATGEAILPVYIFDTRLYQALESGFRKTDFVRFLFQKECVVNLRQNLKDRGGNLLIRFGNPERIIPDLAEKYHCKAIWCEAEFASEEKNTLTAIAEKLPSKCDINEVWGRTLYHLDDIPYAIEEIPLTSKAYRINTTKKTEVRDLLPEPSSISCADLDLSEWGEMPLAEDLGFDENPSYVQPLVKGGEDAALERLNQYSFETEQLTRYRWTRNRSLGMDYSSKFSPYLAYGCLSPRKVYHEVKRYEDEVKKNQSTWWLIFEMVWRDYFTFKLMRFHNKVYQTDGFTNKKIDFENDPALFSRWCEGTTGIPFIDAHMRQLSATGFMSNRGRVNCASFLVHDYKIDWTRGAAWFESKLIDYDVGSNWMNWHMQAYQIWYTNPVNQANKYSAQEFIRKWVPEIADLDDCFILIPWEADEIDYPKPNEIFSKWNRSINKIKKERC